MIIYLLVLQRKIHFGTELRISAKRFRNLDPEKIRIQKLTVDVKSAKKVQDALIMAKLNAGFFKHSTGHKV